MKKVIVLIIALALVLPLVIAGSGFTWTQKFVENIGGDFYLLEFDEVACGNELIVLGNEGENSESLFGKTIVAEDGWMVKAEYAWLDTGAPPHEPKDPYKFEEVEWWATEPCGNTPGNAYINKYTETADLGQQQFLVASGDLGSDTFEISSDNYIYEEGKVMLWPGDPITTYEECGTTYTDWGDAPVEWMWIKPPTDYLDKPDIPDKPDP